jgi:hypothetical protein
MREFGVIFTPKLRLDDEFMLPVDLPDEIAVTSNFNVQPTVVVVKGSPLAINRTKESAIQNAGQIRNRFPIHHLIPFLISHRKISTF